MPFHSILYNGHFFPSWARWVRSYTVMSLILHLSMVLRTHRLKAWDDGVAPSVTECFKAEHNGFPASQDSYVLGGFHRTYALGRHMEPPQRHLDH